MKPTQEQIDALGEMFGVCGERQALWLARREAIAELRGRLAEAKWWANRLPDAPTVQCATNRAFTDRGIANLERQLAELEGQ